MRNKILPMLLLFSRSSTTWLSSSGCGYAQHKIFRPWLSLVTLIPTNGSLVQSLTLYLAASKDATKVSQSAIMFEGPHHLKSSLWNISRMGLPSIHLQKNLGSNGVLLYQRLVTIASTALLKLRPDDGIPYRFPSTWGCFNSLGCGYTQHRFPSTWRIIPGGALIPWGVAIHNIDSLVPGESYMGVL